VSDVPAEVVTDVLARMPRDRLENLVGATEAAAT
jgi:5-deoxy-5-amino-3-dehydroquinate synthase